MADENMAVEVDSNEEAEYNEEDAARAQAMINSPKGQQAMSFDEEPNGDGGAGGMSLTLDAVEDEEYDDPEKATPNTKRDQMDVNSPRLKTQNNNFDEDGSNNAALAGLVTQVDRGDSSQQSGVQSLVTQVPREDGTETEMKRKTEAESGGICSMFSCLMCCCSGPEDPAPVPMVPPTKDGQQTTTQGSRPPDNPKTNLLPQSGQTNGREKDQEESVSSTVYDTALLPQLKPDDRRKCLILDLDETLVHSSFKPIDAPDFVIPVEIDRVVHHVYVLKRPYVDEFLLRASKHYEIVVFTASLSKYADPLLDKLDIHNVIEHRLFRESCVIHGTAYVKDLRKLGRKLKDSIIVDNSPPSYLFQPTNAVPIASWFDDQTDTQLLDFCPVIETTMNEIDDVRKLLDANNKSFRWLCNQAHQPLSKYTVRNDLVNRQ